MTMFSKIIETVIGDKRPWREYKARAARLPPSYRTAIGALERYLNHFGTGGDNTAMLLDLVDLFEQGAASGTPIRRIVGEDPVEFIDTFIQNYPKGHWIARERARLNAAIDRAAAGEGSA
jgi:DNA-binding ferritin-like protein (Dps family)